jgi:predicted anti-sigma-YlaC factor YlaD
MNHLSENLLNEFLDNETAEETRVEVEAHISGCSECRKRMEELRALFVELKRLPDESPTRDLSALALMRLPASGLSRKARLALALQAGAALGLLIGILKYALGFVPVMLEGLHIWERLSHPISIEPLIIELPSLEFPQYKMPIPVPVLVLVLVIVIAFWWLGNTRLLQNGNEYQT